MERLREEKAEELEDPSCQLDVYKVRATVSREAWCTFTGVEEQWYEEEEPEGRRKDNEPGLGHKELKS